MTGEGPGGTGRFPHQISAYERRGSVGETRFPPRERAESERRHVITSLFPNVGSACTIGGNCHVPISGTAVSRLIFTSTTYGPPDFSAVSNASARSPGWSTEAEPAPIAAAIAAKSGFQNSPVECFTK